MPSFTLGELANYKGISYRTMRTRMQELREGGKFKKKFPGKAYTESEAQLIGELLDFTIPQLNGQSKPQ